MPSVAVAALLRRGGAARGSVDHVANDGFGAENVQQRYVGWLLQQEQAGVEFTERQRWWLDRIADVIAQSAGIAPEDLDKTPFTERGGIDGALTDLGAQTAELVSQLNQELTA